VKNNIIYFYPQSGRVNGRCIIIKTTYDISLDFQDSLLPLGFLSRSLSSANASQKKGIIIWEIFPYPAPRLTATMKREWYRSWILWTILSLYFLILSVHPNDSHSLVIASRDEPTMDGVNKDLSWRNDWWFMLLVPRFQGSPLLTELWIYFPYHKSCKWRFLTISSSSHHPVSSVPASLGGDDKRMIW